MRGIWIAAYAIFCAAPVYAQTTYQPAVPRGLPDSAAPQSRELSAPPAAVTAEPAPQVVQPRVPRLVTGNNERRHMKDSDARRCLQLASNRDIHRCAHRYLPREARAKITRTKAAAKSSEPAAASAPRSRAAADIGKADLSNAAPAAKTGVAPSNAAPAAKPGAAKPVETAKVVPSPSAAPPVVDKPPKWTDSAKATVKKQGERLPE